MKDPIWRWPVLVGTVAASGLLIYPIDLGLTRRRILTRLEHLTGNEKHVLQRYLQNDSRAENWGRGGGTVDVLKHDGILFLVAENLPRTSSMDTYAISPIAWKRLKEHPELIDLEPIDSGKKK